MRPDNRRARKAELDCVVTTPPAPTAPTLAVVLCHGYGAPADDLVPLGGELLRALDPDVAAGVRVYFPGAPERAEGVGFGRAWWQLDLERLIALQRGERGAPGARHEEVPEGLARARRMLSAFVDEVARETNLPPGRVMLGGFSQGAMITTDLALRQEEAPAGLAILSGTLLCASAWRERAEKRAGLRVLQSHGRHDPLLPFADAEALRSLLADAGAQVDFHAFDGQHEIPMPVLRALAGFVGSLAATDPR